MKVYPIAKTPPAVASPKAKPAAAASPAAAVVAVKASPQVVRQVVQQPAAATPAANYEVTYEYPAAYQGQAVQYSYENMAGAQVYEPNVVYAQPAQYGANRARHVEVGALSCRVECCCDAHLAFACVQHR